MHRPLLALGTGLAVLLVALASSDAHAGWRKPPASADSPAPPPLPIVPRGSAEPDLATLPSTPPLDLGSLTTPGPRYRQLRPGECQCLAVQFSSLANLLERERAELVASRPCCQKPGVAQIFTRHCDVAANQLRLAIFDNTALEARNRNAGSALELYFKLAEAEAQIDLLDLTRADLADAIRRSEELLAQGFRVPVDLALLKRQLLDAEAERARAQIGVVELNGRLKGLTGLEDLPADELIWPAIDQPVQFTAIDPEAAIAVALEQRPELRLLRLTAKELNAQTLPVIRDFLKGVHGALGAYVRPTKPLDTAWTTVRDLLTGHAVERGLRSGQLQQLLAERERAVADEVRRAVATLTVRGRLVVLSRERVLNAEARRKEAEDKTARGEASHLEVVNANLDWYKARGQLAADVAAWHTAAVQLRQVQGLLVLDCRLGCPPAP